jgi:protein SCO1/2
VDHDPVAAPSESPGAPGRPFLAAAAALFLLGMGALGFAAVRRWNRPAPARVLPAPPAPASHAEGRLPSLPHHSKIPEFTFEECRGGTVSRADLEGKVLVVDFFFTRCPGPCPVMTPNLGALHRLWKDDDRIRIVSFNVDPERDSHEVIREYAERYEAGPRWLFLRSTKAEVLRVSYDGFRIGDDTDPILHSQRFVLVDGEGWIRGYYDGTKDDELALLRSDMDRVLAERRP